MTLASHIDHTALSSEHFSLLANVRDKRMSERAELEWHMRPLCLIIGRKNAMINRLGTILAPLSVVIALNWNIHNDDVSA